MFMKFFKHIQNLLFGKIPSVLPESYSKAIQTRGFIPIHLHQRRINLNLCKWDLQTLCFLPADRCFYDEHLSFDGRNPCFYSPPLAKSPLKAISNGFPPTKPTFYSQSITSTATDFDPLPPSSNKVFESLNLKPPAPTSGMPRPWRRCRLTSRSTRIPTPSSSTCRAEVRRHQGSGGGQQCAGDQRREEARGGEGRWVLTVTVEKLPPPEPKKPKTIEEPLSGFDLGSMAWGDENTDLFITV
ncbi:hypothetical protein CK203_072140 [Vitis vinifera]|uniref:Uncharacterized protein n=1 Tax=Vitis vinifera TaxID=29760 RepID=A0A438EXI2_VITVI|nr:hypothetical protein CK203_072140 [Vitis vinifera]